MNSIHVIAQAVRAITQRAKDPNSEISKALNAIYLPKWKPTTAYAAGTQVVAPTGETVSAKVDFTSGASFSAANWNFPAGGGAVSSVVGQTGAVTGTQILTDAAIAAAFSGKAPLNQPSLTAVDITGIIKPKNYSQIYRVNPAGGTGVYTTINAAITQAHTDNNSDVAINQTNPNYRRLILVEPGTYNESIGNGSGIFDNFIDVVGTGTDTAGMPDPSKVVVSWASDGVTGHSVLNTSAGSHYVANMTFIQATDVVRNGYDAHYDAGTSYRTVIIDGCVFKQLGSNTNNLIQATHSDAVNILWHNCQFIGQPDNVQQLIQLGASATNRKIPSSFVFLNCHATGGYAYDGPNNMAIAINFNQGSTSTSSVRGDIQAWIGGAIDHYNGTHAGAIEHQIHVLNSTYQNVKYIIDPAIQNVYADNYTSVVRGTDSSAVSMPRDGLARRTVDYYYPVKVGIKASIPTPAQDAVTASPVANRLYFVWVPINSTHKVDGITQAIVTASGNVGAGLYSDNNGVPGARFGRSTAPLAATAGMQTILNFDVHPNYVYTGAGGVWVGFAADNATITLAMSNLLSTMTACYYQDLGAGWTSLPITPTPLALPAGTAVPLPRLNAI